VGANKAQKKKARSLLKKQREGTGRPSRNPSKRNAVQTKKLLLPQSRRKDGIHSGAGQRKKKKSQPVRTKGLTKEH